MRVLPILFNGNMVRVILDGRKTVTRRPVKYKYSNTEMKIRADKYGTRLVEIQKDVEGETYGKNEDGSTWHKLRGYIVPKPPYKQGDILYVRETWDNLPVNPDGSYCGYDRYYYRADGDLRPEGWQGNWKPSIHMGKHAARIWLKVTNVRVERLQEITEAQAIQEGIRTYTKDDKLFKYAVTDDWWIDYHRKHRRLFRGTFWQDMPKTAKEAFSCLWNSTIKKSDLELYGWDANPWVWVIEFERCEKPEEV